MAFLHRVDKLLVKIETVFLVLFLTAMIVLSFLQVVLRNFFDTGLLWADPLVRHLIIWVGFIGAAIATSEERHISIDAITKFIPARVQSAVRLITSLFALVVSYYLADAALTFLLDEKAYGGELFLSIPTWVAITIIPAGYALMAVHFLIKIIQHAAEVAGKEMPA